MSPASEWWYAVIAHLSKESTMNQAMQEMTPEDVLFDAADLYERDRWHEVSWALAEAARAGTPREAMAVLERECGLAS